MSSEAKKIDAAIARRRAKLETTAREDDVLRIGEAVDFAAMLPSWVRAYDALDETSKRAWDERVRRVNVGSATPEDVRLQDLALDALNRGLELPVETRAMPGSELPRSRRAWHPDAIDNPQRAVAMGVPPLIADEIARGDGRDTKSTRACDRVGYDYLILVLIGERGCGKTYAAARWLWKTDHDRFVPYAMRRRVQPRRFLEAPALAEVEFADRARVGECTALVLDDLGTEKDFLRQDLARLLVARYRNGLPTVVTTNASQADVGEYYGLRFIDRMREVGKFLVVSNDARDSMRGRK